MTIYEIKCDSWLDGLKFPDNSSAHMFAFRHGVTNYNVVPVKAH